VSGLSVLSPSAGRVLPLAEVPDPVFAAELVGAGVAVEPPQDGGAVQALAPIAGTVVKLHPHAFVIVGEGGTGVLVHLGIDTVELAGDGFELLVAERSSVTAGQPITQWDPGAIAARGLDPVIMVCVLDSEPGSVHSAAIGGAVAAGDEVFDWPPPAQA
jgi:PTS system glucose-specific IIA component/PTS system N-acetylglucosamine-specific IIA component